MSITITHEQARRIAKIVYKLSKELNLHDFQDAICRMVDDVKKKEVK